MANTKITNPELFNLGDSTSATQLPVMTTAQRIAMNAPITTPFNIDYLVVAGGGGGGPGYQAGGGGAGGLLTNVGGTGLSLNTSVSYTVTVGAGGAGGASLTGSGANKGSNGSDSQFASLPDAVGGGGGASYWNGSNAFGLDGGSGGGAAYTNFNTTTAKSGGAATAGQGNAGGGVASGTYSSPYKAGGGGGAGSAGINGTPDNGNGGDGLLNNITGTSLFYAAGGGAGGYNSAGSGGSSIGGSGSLGSTGTAPTSGTANTGSGGGGAGNTGVAGAAGGSGIVILRYPTADVASYTATGLTLTETTVGTDTILSFTTVGTGTISFTSSTPTNTISTGEMIFNSTTDKVEYFDGTKWYGITYEAGWSADLFGDGSNMFTSDFSNSTPTVIEGNGASIFVDPSFPGGVIGYNSNVPNAGFEKSMVGTANIANQIFGYSMQSGDSVTSVKTYSFWVYVTKIDDDDNWVLSTNMKRQNFPDMWQYSWSTAGAAGPIDTFTPVSINTWHNIVVVDEGTVMRTYLDNVSIGTISISSNVLLRSTFLRIYQLADADSRNTQFVTGIRMFDRAVTASEVDTIYNEVPEYT